MTLYHWVIGSQHFEMVIHHLEKLGANYPVTWYNIPEQIPQMEDFLYIKKSK